MNEPVHETLYDGLADRNGNNEADYPAISTRTEATDAGTHESNTRELRRPFIPPYRPPRRPTIIIG